MKRFRFVFLLVLTGFVLATSAQINPKHILDTIPSDKGPIVLFKNHAWEYLEAIPIMFDPELDTTGICDTGWITGHLYALNGMKPDSIQDTVLLLVNNQQPFHPPLPEFDLIRGFRYTHKGLDMRLKTGDTVRAAFDGVVRYARYNHGGYGNLVIIRHYNGLETFYAHLSKIKVKENQTVYAGRMIGLGGSTGRSVGPHLHFEVRYQDVPLDPVRLIDTDSCRLISSYLPIKKEVFYPTDWDHEAVYHKIRLGNTLGHLASKYHTSVKEICAMNKIRTTTVLRIGQVLRVR